MLSSGRRGSICTGETIIMANLSKRVQATSFVDASLRYFSHFLDLCCSSR